MELSTQAFYNLTKDTLHSNSTPTLAITTLSVIFTLSNNSDSFPAVNQGGRPRGPPILTDKSYYVIPEATATLVRKICYLGITPVMVFIGLVLNTFCLMMFIRMTPKTSTVVMLLTLAVTDIVYAISAGFHALFVSSGLYDFPFTVDQRIQAVPYFYSFVRPLPGRFGAVLTLLISFERLFCVLQPMKIRQYSTKKNAIIAVSTLVVLTIGLSTPLAMVNQTKQMYINATKTYVRIIEPTEFGKNTEIVDLIYLLDEIVFGFIPVVGVAITGLITATVVVRSAKIRSKLTSSTRKRNNETQITKTLLALIFIFFVCKLPAQTLGLIIFIRMKPYKYESNVYEVALAVTYIPLLANAVINLVVYYVTSSTYRAKIKEILHCSTTNRNDLRSSSGGQSETASTDIRQERFGSYMKKRENTSVKGRTECYKEPTAEEDVQIDDSNPGEDQKGVEFSNIPEFDKSIRINDKAQNNTGDFSGGDHRNLEGNKNDQNTGSENMERENTEHARY